MCACGITFEWQWKLQTFSEAIYLNSFNDLDVLMSHCSSKGSTLSKRPVRKGEDGRNFEMREPLPLDDMERNQKILQWMMEGEKEAGRSKRSPYGWESLISLVIVMKVSNQQFK